MIAEVYPLKKMPRKVHFFDYEIPKDLTIKRGNIVSIPFRSITLLGVVKRVKQERPRGFKLKPIISKREDLVLSEQELAFFESCAKDLAQSTASLLYSILPSPPKRKSWKSHSTIHHEKLTIPKKETMEIIRLSKELAKRTSAFISLPDLRRMGALIAAYLHEHTDEKTLIITPTARDAQLLFSYIGKLTNARLITGEESNNERYDAWLSFRQGKANTIIGSRLATFYTHPKLSSIFLIRSSHSQHKQADRNPRFDTRIITQKLKDQFKGKRFLFDVCPRVDEYISIDQTHQLRYSHTSPISLIEMNKQSSLSPHPLIGDESYSHILGSLKEGRKVLCVFNKKGSSRKLFCHDCSHAYLCDTCQRPFIVYDQSLRCHGCRNIRPLPHSCDNCNSTNLSRKGIGIGTLKKILEKMTSKTVCRIDKEHTDIDETADIFLVTNYFFENIYSSFKTGSFGTVILIDADTGLFEQSFRSLERTLIGIKEWHGIAHGSYASCLVQTHTAELLAPLQYDIESLLRAEAHSRHTYHQPPYKKWIRITYKSKDEKEIAHALRKLLSSIQELSLPEDLPSLSIQSEKIEFALKHEYYALLYPIFSTLDDRYIIDTNAFS